MRLLLLIALPLIASVTSAQASSWQDIGRALGHELRAEKSGGAVSVIPRKDLQVQSSTGMLLPPQMGLESEVRFDSPSERANVSGQICLMHDEIDPVLDTLCQQGISVVGLRSRFAGESPAVYFVEFEASGDAKNIAGKLHAAFRDLGKVGLVRQGLMRTGKAPDIDWPKVSAILRTPVSAVPSSEVRAGEFPRGSVRFAGCPCGGTTMVGNIRSRKSDLQHVIVALRIHAISIDSITQEGGQYSVWFEGLGDAVSMAEGVHQALQEAPK